MPANQIRLSDITYSVLECDIRASTTGLLFIVIPEYLSQGKIRA